MHCISISGVPDSPVDVKFVTCPSGRAEISWSPGNDNGYRISAYFIQYNSSHNPSLWRTYEEPIKPSLNNYYMDLRPWGKYSIRMLAENKLGLSKPSLPTKKTCSAPSKHPDRNPKEVWTRTDQTGKLIIQWTVSKIVITIIFFNIKLTKIIVYKESIVIFSVFLVLLQARYIKLLKKFYNGDSFSFFHLFQSIDCDHGGELL